MPLAHPLHVLILETSPAQTAMLVEFLADSLEFENTRVTNEAEYTSQLSENVDLILAGTLSPPFNALEALQLLHSRGLDIPFIVVIDATDEDMALECLKRGAADYVFKDRLKRLGLAVAKVLADRRLRDEQHRLYSAVEHSASSVVITDLQGNIEYVNARFTTLTGYTAAEVIGQNPRFLKSGETPPEEYQHLWQTIVAGGEWRGEFHNRKKNGDLYWEWASISAIKDASGRVTSFLAVKEDITERKQIEERLRESEEQFRSSFKYAAIGKALVSLEGHWLEVNEAVCEIVGYSQAELLTTTFQDITHPDDLESDLNNVRQLVAGEIQTYQMEKRYFHKLGHEIWVLLSVSLVRDREERPRHFISQIQDITERKLAQAKLAEERNLLRTLIDSTPDYIFIKDAQGFFMLSNRAHAEAARMAPHELVGKTAFEIFSPELAAQFHADDGQVLQTGRPLINLERVTVGVNGEDKTVLTSKIPLTDQDGRINGLVGISRDITDRKQLEAQTIELGAERERSNVLKRFIRDMSHDFRTPLSILNTSLYLMRKHTDPRRQQDYAERIEEQIKRIDRLLDELLQMARLDEHGPKLQLVLADLDTFLAPIIQDYQPQAAEKQISLRHTAPDGACLAQIDRVEFARAFVALVENAITYTPEGGSVHIQSATVGEQAVISIRDTGIGIARHELPHIFERFYRADEARSTSIAGNGLGLTIALSIVAAHGGTIGVESEAGQGSTFSIRLPRG